MAVGALPVQSDPTLLADIRRYGKFDPTGCYQCGSCTLSCDLVEDSATFPRRSIRYALLGLRQPLVESLDPWVCHDCGDCSAACPRQAEPRISMLTLRRFLSAQYDWTGIAPKLLQSTAWYLGSLILRGGCSPLLLILGYHLWYVEMPATQLVTTPLGLEHMFPLMTYYTLTVVLVPLLFLLSRVFRIWRLTMSAEERAHIPFSAYVAELRDLRAPVGDSLADAEVPGTGPVARTLGLGPGHSDDAHHQGVRPAVVSNRQPLSLLQSPALARIPRRPASFFMAWERFS